MPVQMFLLCLPRWRHSSHPESMYPKVVFQCKRKRDPSDWERRNCPWCVSIALLHKGEANWKLFVNKSARRRISSNHWHGFISSRMERENRCVVWDTIKYTDENEREHCPHGFVCRELTAEREGKLCWRAGGQQSGQRNGDWK